jgi:amidohydrolase
MAILMGAAEILAGMRDALPGTIKFIFQPAEEGAPKGEEGGAKLMIAEGVLKNPDVDAVIGLHISQGGVVGTASYRSLGFMASAQRFDIQIQGKQTHGARPWAGVDPIVVGAQIVNALQTIVSRQIDITQHPAVVTVGSFAAGVRNNIVPETATLSGTIRTFDAEVRSSIHEKIRSIAEQTANAMGALATVEIDPGVPVTFNDLALTEQMVPTLERVYGEDEVFKSPRVTGAEDFSFYQEQVPGFFFFIGARPPQLSAAKAIPNHSPFFYVDEDALAPAVQAMTQLAIDYLGAGAR